MTRIWFNQGYSVVREALLLIRSGAAEAGIADLHLIASHADPHAAVLDAADEAFVEPKIDRSTPEGMAQYAAWCASVCADRAVDLFIVQGAQTGIAGHLDLFPASTRVFVSADADMLAAVADKARFTTMAVDAGLPLPWTRAVADAAEYDAAVAQLEQLGLPGCVKPREGVFGHGFWRFDPDATAFDALMNGDARRISAPALREAIAKAGRPVDLLVMQHLPGPEWSLDCVCDNGQLILGVARRKAARVQELEVDGPIFDYARRAVALFNLSGLINVQFKAADEAGDDPHLLEINPRMSGGMARTRFAGVNLPWLNVARLLGISAGEMPVPVGGALVSALDDTVAPVLPVEAQRA